MSVHELRGYVRARAAGPVRSQAVKQMQGLAGMTPAACKAVLREATERVVHLVVREYVAAPAVAGINRRAA
jgi:hypothetical protein